MERGERPHSLDFRYKRIEEYVTENLDELELLMDELVVGITDGIDYESAEAFGLVQRLVTVLDPDFIHDPDLAALCYKGYRLGWMIADMATPQDLKMTLRGLVDENTDYKDVWAEIIGTTHEFLSHSPNIDAMIGKYQLYIDPSGRYSHQIEVFAGLAVAMTDSAERYIAIDREVSAFSNRLDSWEGEPI